MTFSLRSPTLATSLTLAALLAWAPTQAAPTSLADYKAGKARIAADFQVDKRACQSLAANTKDICQEEAKAKESNHLAALEYSHTGKADDRKKMIAAQIDSAHDVAGEKCDDLTGDAKASCQGDAQARFGKL